MKLPKGFSPSEGRSSKTHVLKLLKNIYGLKQAGRVWNDHLHKGLVELGYRQSKVDPCLYYRKNALLAVYIDDCILAIKEESELKKAIKEIAEKFEITDEGEVDEYLGVKIEKQENGTIKIYQPYLIRQILEALGYNEKTKAKNTPAVSG